MLIGYHRGCGGEVHLRVHHNFRHGFDRFAEPDDEEVRCALCGETDLPDEEIAEVDDDA